MCDKYDFSSAFTPMLSGFICEKQSLGYKYESEARCLQHFDRYCNDHSFPPVLSEEVVMGYVRPDPNRCIKTTLNRIGLLRQFALYLHRNGHDAWLYPEELFPKKEAVSILMFLQMMKSAGFWKLQNTSLIINSTPIGISCYLSFSALFTAVGSGYQKP